MKWHVTLIIFDFIVIGYQLNFIDGKTNKLFAKLGDFKA